MASGTNGKDALYRPHLPFDLDRMKEVINRRKSFLAISLILLIIGVIFLVPFIPETVTPPFQSPSHFVFRYYVSISYRLTGQFGETYWNGGFYWGPPPPIFYV